MGWAYTHCMANKATKIGWWVTTALVVLPNVGAAMGYLSGKMDEAFIHLGYPLFVASLLGIWKILGGVALLNPKRDAWSERIREWAYAGYFFVLSGAFVSHLGAGDGIGEAAPPLVILALFAPASMLFPTDAALETVGLLIICIGLYGLYSPAISWAGMALGYKLHRDEIARQRKAEAMPEIDYEAERNNLRTLRAQRAVESAGATMYDPRAARMANSGPDTGETSAE